MEQRVARMRAPLTGSAKQFMARHRKLDCFVASLPCANASCLSQAMTGMSFSFVGWVEPFAKPIEA